MSSSPLSSNNFSLTRLQQQLNAGDDFNASSINVMFDGGSSINNNNNSSSSRNAICDFNPFASSNMSGGNMNHDMFGFGLASNSNGNDARMALTGNAKTNAATNDQLDAILHLANTSNNYLSKPPTRDSVATAAMGLAGMNGVSGAGDASFHLNGLSPLLGGDPNRGIARSTSVNINNGVNNRNESSNSQSHRHTNSPTAVPASSYRDFSRVVPDRKTSDKQQQANGGSATTSNKEPTFPVKLHMILSNPKYEDIIAWLPHGRSWRILQQKAFEEHVIPLYFRHGRYSSFARQVNGWGFRRITHGSDYNSYFHELFLRGMPHLCNRMRRLTTKDMANRKKNDEEPTPDFYALSQKNPLPEVSPVPTSPPTTFGSGSGLSTALGRSSSATSSCIGNGNDVMSMLSRTNQPSSQQQQQATFPEVELAMLERRRTEILERMGVMAGTNDSSSSSHNNNNAGGNACNDIGTTSNFGNMLNNSLSNVMDSMGMTSTSSAFGSTKDPFMGMQSDDINMLAAMQQQQQQQQQSQRRLDNDSSMSMQQRQHHQARLQMLQQQQASLLEKQKTVAALQQQLLENRLRNQDLTTLLGGGGSSNGNGALCDNANGSYAKTGFGLSSGMGDAFGF